MRYLPYFCIPLVLAVFNLAALGFPMAYIAWFSQHGPPRPPGLLTTKSFTFHVIPISKFYLDLLPFLLSLGAVYGLLLALTAAFITRASWPWNWIWPYVRNLCGIFCLVPFLGGGSGFLVDVALELFRRGSLQYLQAEFAFLGFLLGYVLGAITAFVFGCSWLSRDYHKLRLAAQKRRRL